MSVANIAFLEDRILCLSDTLQYTEDGEPGGLRDSKTSVHNGFALTARGLVCAGNAVKGVACLARDLDHSRGLLDAAHREILAHRDEDPAIRLETTVMGWSAERGDLVVWRWEIRNGSDEVTFSELPRGLHLAPSWVATAPEMPADMGAERMVKIALAQWRIAQQFQWRMCIGERMHLTTVTRDGITQDEVGRYPDYADHAARFGDPLVDAHARGLALA